MLTERMIYLQEMDRTKTLRQAMDLLKAWSEEAKGQNVTAAACFYLTHFVIPTLQGIAPSLYLPRWVDTALFHPPLESIETVDEWISLFPETSCEALHERKGREEPRYGAWIPLGQKVTAERIIKAREGNYGLYFTPNSVRGHRSSEAVYQSNACFADFDLGDKESQMKVIESLPIKPSAIIESGNGYHVYWLLSKPTDKLELWKRIQKKIIALCGSDPKIKNLDRLMRLPFTWHTKKDPKLFVTIKLYTQARYTIEELEIAFPPEPERVYKPYEEARPKSIQLPSMTPLAPGGRHGALEEETAKMYAGLPMEKSKDAREALKYWYSRSCQPLKSYWEREVDEMCDWVERKQYGV